MTLVGTVSVVTGASRGLGRAIAAHLGSRGATVAICARTPAMLDAAAAALRARGVPVIAATADVSDPDAVERFAELVAEHGEPVRALINNAGVLGPVGSLDTVDLGEWRRALEVNVLGVVNASAIFAPMLSAAGGGSIVNLSGGGLGGSNIEINISAYTSGKAAVAVLTETLARELTPRHIRVNAVAPGPLVTELMRPVLEAGPAQAGEHLYETARTIYEQTPGGLPAEFVSLLDYLLDDESSWLTGRLISARWDPTDELRSERSLIASGSRFTLRRIDDRNFREDRPR